MGKLTKRQERALLAKENEHIFRCPLCGEEMEVTESLQLVCGKNHSFDFAKQGYVNMLTKPVSTKYSKELFQARKHLMKDDGFFEPVIAEIGSLITEYAGGDDLRILDTGCGDGTHLAMLMSLLEKQCAGKVSGAGIDLAKEGVLEAAKHEADIIWTVADLAKMPFDDSRFDIILNILSPSNYGEFSRLLGNGGLIIKAVPGAMYLKELREEVFKGTDKEAFSNKETVARFKEHFDLVKRVPVSYTRTLDREAAGKLIRMTPLTWEASTEVKERLLARDPFQVTVEIELIAGRKRE